MKTKMFAVVAALLLTLVAGKVSHAQDAPLYVKVPFDFQIGDQMMPAGEYLVERPVASSWSLQRLRQVNGDAVMTISTVPTEAKNGDRVPELIFNVYGRTHFLAQIWVDSGHGHQILKSKREKEMLRSVQGTEVALLFLPGRG